MKKFAATTAILGCLFSINSYADNTPILSDGYSPGDSDSKWLVGAHAVTLNNPYKSADNISLLLPVIEYRGDIFFLKDGEFGAKVFGTGETENGIFSTGLLIRGQASYLEDKDNYDDDEALIGLKERESVGEGGIYFRHKSELGQAKIKLFTNLNDEDHGNSAEAQYIFDLGTKQWQINQTITAIWQDSDRVNHFFGVSASEATDTRAEYQGKSAINLAVGIDGRYRVNENWDIKAGLAYVYLDDAITESSIVSEDGVSLFSMGTEYNF
ncbi:MAG: MipA/OmpV family protein [Bermanella sp.]